MNYQEDDQKKAGKRHDKLFTDRGSKKRFPGHEQILFFKRCANVRKENSKYNPRMIFIFYDLDHR